MLLDRSKRKLRRARMPHPTDDAAMATGGDVPSRARVGFLDIPRGEDLLVENRHCADKVAPIFIGPDFRRYVIYRIDNIPIAIVADCAMGALRRITDNRHRGVDHQVEPVAGLLDKGTSLQPNRAAIGSP